MTYIVALLIGIILGILFSATTVPVLIFTSISLSSSSGNSSIQAFYALQHFLPVQLVFPTTLALAFALLAASCLGVLGITFRIVTQFSLTGRLRLNED